MKKIILIIICMLFLSSCTSESKIYVDIPETPAAQNLDLPFYVDFLKDEWTDYVYSPKVYSYENWYIESVSTKTVDYANIPIDEKTIVLQKDYVEQIPPGANGPSLYFGNPELKNYNFSFDFFTKDNSGLNFSIYTESLSTEWREGEKQPFYFTLGSDHGLSFETAFGTGSFFYKSEDGEILLNDFDSSVWNTVELIMYDYDLHFVFNGIDYGVIYTFDGTQHGGAAIGCRGNVMFKNIKLTPLV